MLNKGQTNSGSFKKGQKPWNFGQKSKGMKNRFCAVCNKAIYVRPCRFKKKNFCSNSCAALGFKGRPSWNKGTAKISTENELVRKSPRYKLWREAVFERDNFTCQECNQYGGRLNADHIKPFSKFKELRFEITNGRTLCESCHKKTDTYGWNIYHKNDAKKI